MRLSELVGAKSTFGGVKQAHADNESSNGITQALKQYGYGPVGGGAFGKVYQKEGQSTVLKVFLASDTGYLKFLKFCAQYGPSKHLPKFYGRLLNLEKYVGYPVMAIRMEKLTHVSHPGISDSMWKVIDSIQSLWGMSLEYFQEELVDYAGPELVAVIYALERGIKGDQVDRFDLHGGNYMMRGQDVVIIDPYAPQDINKMARF